MLKQAWRSYASEIFRANRMKRKESKYSSFCKWIMYCCVFSIFFYRLYRVVIFVQLLPILMMYRGNKEGVYLEKNMFLSPMKKKERETYVQYMLLLKIGIPLLLGFFVELIGSFLLEIDMYGSIGKMLCCLFAGVGIYIHADGVDKIDGRIVPVRKGRDGKLRWSWMNTLTHIVAVCTIILYNIAYLSYMGSQFPMYLLGCSVVLLFIWSAIIIITQYRAMIDYVTDYERVHGISTKYIEEEK